MTTSRVAIVSFSPSWLAETYRVNSRDPRGGSRPEPLASLEPLLVAYFGDSPKSWPAPRVSAPAASHQVAAPLWGVPATGERMKHRDTYDNAQGRWGEQPRSEVAQRRTHTARELVGAHRNTRQHEATRLTPGTPRGGGSRLPESRNSRISFPFMPGYGVAPRDRISHMVTPKDHTSLLWLNLL